jgi:small nuclear ribonucleoprotein F
MNILLTESEEIINSKIKGKLGEILIRCNNILYIKEAK